MDAWTAAESTTADFWNLSVPKTSSTSALWANHQQCSHSSEREAVRKAPNKRHLGLPELGLVEPPGKELLEA